MYMIHTTPSAHKVCGQVSEFAVDIIEALNESGDNRWGGRGFPV